ncbi:hypothetical protein L3X38_025816 [Prunus dulcis]|uniref:BED zinc finger n=1 Tax=Prunus dulcis TaxID=3755 RepID=A0AAD4W496_PRUDU|nr:hypothetical protein L3X38_025816 [Prunus dulcis]
MVVRDELPFSFVEDNVAANTKAIEYVRKKINGWKDSNSVLGGVHMHMRCSAHIINLIVKEGLKRLESSIVAIRNAVKFVRSSPSRLSYFKMCVETEKIECKGLVVMDVPTRWNSTYLMLDAALKFRKAFDRMGDDPDSSYLMYFKEEEGDDERIEGIEGSGKRKGKSKTNKRVGPPSDEDWEKAVTIMMFLKTFYDVTLKISASLHPTSHSTFHDLLAIDGEIRKLNRYDVTIPLEERTTMDTLLNDMAASMKKKYDKYWGELHKVNPFLIIGVVIDPRFKLRNLKHIFEEIFENDPTCDRLVAQKTNEVKQLLMNMYEVYKTSSNNMGATSTTNESGGSTNNETDSSLVFGGRERKTMMEKWKKIQQESENVVITHEVDRYLLDPLESIDEEFDILGWWRINGLKYPTLASIAKDVLAIPTSIIASESCFSTSGRVIDSFRSSLSPRMVEALICSQNWIRSEDISSLQYVPRIEEMEFYESIEMGVKFFSSYGGFQAFEGQLTPLPLCGSATASYSLVVVMDLQWGAIVGTLGGADVMDELEQLLDDYYDIIDLCLSRKLAAPSSPVCG